MSAGPTHTPADPTIAVVERQLAMLGAVAAMAMEVTRGCAAAALAASNAVEVILADEFYQPETGRARALAGSRDAADAFQKASRSLRLTLALELTTAEALRDLRAGVVAMKEVGEHARAPVSSAWSAAEPRRPADSPPDSPADDAPDRDRSDSDCERLVEFDRPDCLPRGAFHAVADGIRADIGAAPDWTSWTADWPDLKYQPLMPKSPEWSETRPSGPSPPGARYGGETGDGPAAPPGARLGGESPARRASAHDIPPLFP